MMDPPKIQEALAELGRESRQSLINYIVTLLLRLSNVDEIKTDLTIQHSRADLYARRCQLAIEICRDDERGLSHAQLDAIATVIWPATTENLNVTQKT